MTMLSPRRRFEPDHDCGAGPAHDAPAARSALPGSASAATPSPSASQIAIEPPMTPSAPMHERRRRKDDGETHRALAVGDLRQLGPVETPPELQAFCEPVRIDVGGPEDQRRDDDDRQQVPEVVSERWRTGDERRHDDDRPVDGSGDRLGRAREELPEAAARLQ